MPDYQRMYTVLFNTITAVLDMLKEGQAMEATYLLKQAQMQTEGLYISAPAEAADKAPAQPLQDK